jgi:nucleoside-diphosphate-sugar epimerase
MTALVVYNGQTGSLGACMAAAAERRGARALALRARLEQREQLRQELEGLQALAAGADLVGARLTFVQMAARVSVPACERDPEGAFRTNVTDTVATVDDVCSWADRHRLALGVVYVSSGHVYAPQPQGRLVTERDPVAPRSVYARSKLEAEERLTALAQRRGRQLVVARVFGLLAPRQPESYLLPGLIRRVRDEQLQGIPGLSFFRDYLDARDVCEALLDLGEKAPLPESLYNVCSGEPTCLRDLLAAVAGAMKPARAAELLAHATEAPARPDDIPWIVGDPARVSAPIGHAPRRRPLVETVGDAVRAQGRT